MATQDGRLLEAFFEVGSICYLDNSSKAALRLCNKKIKSWIDATVIACKVGPDASDALLRCNWPHLAEVELCSLGNPKNSPTAWESLLCAVISKFPTLEKLRIKTNCIDRVSLPDAIGKLSHLKVFNMDSYMGLTALPPSFGQLTALEQLHLPFSVSLTLEGLAPIKELKQLKNLFASGVFLHDPLFPEWVRSCQFTLLETIWLMDPNGNFHSSICTTFKHLTHLHISGCASLEVPESIGYLSSLQYLTLYARRAPISLPESFSKLTSLQELEMVPNMDGIAPLQHLTGLTKLSLHAAFEDRFENYPDFIWDLSSLKVLKLTSGRYVRSLPDDAFHKLKNLLDLKLDSFESLQELPDSIGSLALLENIIIEADNVSSLPESIGNLVSLRSFVLRHSEYLSTLPDSIGNLKNLTSLELSILGKLTKLPSTIGDLEALQRLVVRRCDHLMELPETIGKLHALQELVIKDCNTRFRIPDSSAELVFGTASEDTSSLKTALTMVAFNSELEISDRCLQALDLLKEHGIYKKFYR